jgi:Gpi18-like mannosyltransferase
VRHLLDRYFIITTFIIWRLGLFLVAFWSIFFIPNFGASFPYYKELLVSSGLPYWIWGFGNFDGVHYLTIAQSGYSADYTQAFFPFFPVLISFFSFGQGFLAKGLILSNLLLILALFMLYKLFRLDFDKKIARKSIVLLLLFPTAFYLGSLYSESLFIFLAILAIYLVRKKYIFWACFVAAFASATRIMGILLFLVLFIEIYNYQKTLRLTGPQKALKFSYLLFVPIGLVSYMVFLSTNFSDPLYFLNAQPAFGAARSAAPIILPPQVMYRYFKILITVPVSTYPFWTAFLELAFTVLPLVLVLVFWKKVRLSYLVFVLGGLIVPTLTGTLSSMPRYSLMVFLIFPFFVQKYERFLPLVYLIFLILQVILLSLFIRGYWVA